jgi:NarL family two-component system response regulator LiaR
MADGNRIRVFLVDDHEMVRSGLAVFLDGFDDLVLVGEAANGQQAVDLCAGLQPDVVLMDLMLPDISGIEATRLIRQANPAVRVIALTSFHDDTLVQTALQAGANGFLFKNASVDELADAIRVVHSGKPVLSAEATQALIGLATSPPGPSTQRFDLTERERQVLALVVKGLTNRQIAARLSLSPSTVKAYVSNILSKLGVASRTEAVVLALEHNLVK